MIPALVLAALVVVLGTGDRTGRPGALATALLAVVWLLVNKPMEGETLLVVTENHGLSAGDLAGLAALAVAAWRFRRARPLQRSRRHPDTSERS